MDLFSLYIYLKICQDVLLFKENILILENYILTNVQVNVRGKVSPFSNMKCLKEFTSMLQKLFEDIPLQSK